MLSPARVHQVAAGGPPIERATDVIELLGSRSTTEAMSKHTARARRSKVSFAPGWVCRLAAVFIGRALGDERSEMSRVTNLLVTPVREARVRPTPPNQIAAVRLDGKVSQVHVDGASDAASD